MKMGYHLFAGDGYGLRRWELYDEKTGEWLENNKIPGRYIATWVNSAKSLRIVLSMKYKYNYKDPDWIKKLSLNLSVQPFFTLPQVTRGKR